MKSSTIKIYFNAVAEGDVELLRQLLIRHPSLLNLNNKNTYHKAIYYAAKNLKKEATLYLLNRGLKLSHRELDRLITHEWYGNLASLYFLIDIGENICGESEGLSKIDFRFWIEEKYIQTYYTHRNIERLIKFFESSKREVNWQSILEQYLRYSGSSQNSNHLKFVRELKLRTLL